MKMLILQNHNYSHVSILTYDSSVLPYFYDHNKT